MTLTFTVQLWWAIPTLITVVGLLWALFWVDDGPGMFSGLGNIFALVPVFFISTIAWIIGAILK